MVYGGDTEGYDCGVVFDGCGCGMISDGFGMVSDGCDCGMISDGMVRLGLEIVPKVVWGGSGDVAVWVNCDGGVGWRRWDNDELSLFWT